MATATPAKRVLAESTNTSNISPQTSMAKKRKLDRFQGDRNIPNGDRISKLLSSQPRSQFEEHLESLSQNMEGLRENNHEKDQQWERPSLADFSEETDNLCFQQIDVEEGTIQGGKQTIRLFGVTEVPGLFCSKLLTC
jgi:DNA polymerase delta subunit 1